MSGFKVSSLAGAVNVISGKESADTLTGGDGADEVFGYGSADSLAGGGGEDTIWGGWGNDTLLGGAGADLLVGELGDDLLDGGQDGDTYRVSGNSTTGFHGHDTYKDSGTDGIDRIVVLGTGDVDIGIKGFAATGIEEIDARGATGTVRLLDTSAASLIDLRGVTITGTNVVIDGGNGNDTIFGSAAADTLVAGSGDDVLDGAGGGDAYRVTGNATASFQGHDSYADSGAEGIDRIAATGTGNVDIGLKGNFSAAASGIEVIDGSGATGTVRILGESTANVLDLRGITITGTNVVIDGGNGNDTIFGSAAADTLVSHSGEDVVDGAGGGDTYRVTGNLATGFHGYDTFKDSGTEGIDRIVALGTGNVDIGVRGFSATGIEEIDARGATGTVRLLDTGDANLIDLRGVTVLGTNLVIDTGSGNDTVFGSAAADLIVAGSGDDVLDGAGDGDTWRVSGNTTTGFQGHDTYKDTGTSGVDRIEAIGTGNVDIGVRGFSASGVEQIDGRGATGTVRLLDTDAANLIDLRGVSVVGTNVVIDANFGNDTIHGSAGADTIVGAGGNDWIDGGEGGDTYRVTGNEAGGWSSFHNHDTWRDSGTTGVDRIVAVGTGNVDIGVAGNFSAGLSGIEEIDARGATGTVRLYGDGSATLLDFRGVTLQGTNIVIDSSHGNDTVYGSAAADTLLASWGDDVLDGAGGGDTYRVTGNTTANFQGHDTYADTGTSGVDRIAATGTGNVDIGLKGNFSAAASGIEVIDGSGATGTVRILGESSANLIDLRGITITGANVVIDGGNGNDTIFGSAAADILVSHNGEDVVDGAGGGDTYRVTGNTTTGFHGYDTFKDSGTSGTDRIVATGTGPVDIGLAGAFNAAASGIEVIDGSGATGTVRILGDSTASVIDLRGITITGTNVVIDGGNGNDTIFGSAAADTLVSHSGEDVVDGAGGGDTYRVTGNLATGFHGYDTFKDSGTEGIDRIVALGTGNVDIGVRGFSATGIEEIDARGATGTVRLLDTGDANLIDLRGVTVLGTNLVIDTGSGDDTVFGSAAADIIVAGNGWDSLDGGEGSDTYRVGGNFSTNFQGYDAYKDTGTSGVDRIEAIGTGNVDIGVRGFSASGVEQIDGRGATGTVRLLDTDAANLIDLRGVSVVGTNVVIDANFGNDTIHGSAGADTIVGAGGNDWIDGGEGGDTYRVTGNEAGGWSSFHNHDTWRDSGTTGVDRIVAVGTGNVDIGVAGNFSAALSGIEVIDGSGATGTVRILGESSANVLDLRGITITGTNVVIDGGNGNDTIFGSAAADTLVSHNGEDVIDGAGGGDTFRVTGNLATGFHGYDTFKDSGTEGIDRIVALGTGNVDIGVRGFSATGIEEIDARGATGTVRLLDTGDANLIDLRGVTVLGTNLVIDAGHGNDTVFGSAGADTIVGGAADDLLDGGEGGDTFQISGNEAGGWSGFHGYDTFKDSGAGGTDRIVALGSGPVDIGLRSWVDTGIEQIDASGAAGTVRLLGDTGNNLFDFRSTTLTGANLVIDANRGHDTVFGSAGDDTIVGGAGDDVLDGGEGSDTYRITGGVYGSTEFMGWDTWADTGLDGTDRIVAISAGSMDIGVRDLSAGGIEILDVRGVAGQARLLGTSSDDIIDLSGTTVQGSLLIDAGGGTDLVLGSSGNDTLLGSGGADSLAGGAGNDVYRIGRDTGMDVIWDWDDTAGNQDVVEFDAGISAEQLWFQRLDGFVEVTVLGTWNRIYLMDWDTDPAARIEVFRTADGRTLQAAQVDTLIEAMSAFAMPSIGTTTLPADHQAALQPVIAGTWSS